MAVAHAPVIDTDVALRPAVHPFPARMSAGLAGTLIKEAEERRALPGRGTAGAGAGGGGGAAMTVIDPMAGSGTVLAAAARRGHTAIGLDVDPLAVLMTRVASYRGFGSGASMLRLAESILDAATRDVVSRRGAGDERWSGGMDEQTRGFVSYWFDDTAACQLAALSCRIAAVSDPRARDIMHCAMSRTIIRKKFGASRAADLAHSRPHRAFDVAPRMPFGEFYRDVRAVLAACGGGDWRRGEEEAAEGGSVQAAVGDARMMGLPDGAADMVLTSPPYINAIDYMRCSKFSLVWMGYDVGRLRSIRAASIGTEVGLYGRGGDGGKGDAAVESVLAKSVGGKARGRMGRRRHAILARYARDMIDVMGETCRVLAAGGTAAFVVGENVVRGAVVPTPEIVRQAAVHAGLVPRPVRYRELPASRRYMPPPPPSDAAAAASAPTLGTRMCREAIVMADRP